MIFMVVAGGIRHNLLVIHLVLPRVNKETQTALDDLYTVQEVA